MSDRRAAILLLCSRPSSRLFVLFLYGPMITIFVLSFQGPEGGLTFPMNGVSLHWFAQAVRAAGGRRHRRRPSRARCMLGVIVMVVTVVLSVSAGLAFRKRVPRREHPVLRRRRQPDRAVDHHLARHRAGIPPARRSSSRRSAEGCDDRDGALTSGLGAHLTWTLPFGLLIMFAVFNRFDRRYEEAARDLGATPWQTFRHVVLPIIAAQSVVGIGLFGFTLS